MTLTAMHEDMTAADRMHVPVMVAEVRALLAASAPRVIVDATVGTGGHAAALLEASLGARLLGFDGDAGVLAVARERLQRYGARVTLRHCDFASIADAMAECGFAPADAILADLGMSSYALDDPERGLSFRFDGPLDMRMDRSGGVRAYDLVNEDSEVELARILFEYGEERASRRIARAIVNARRIRPVATTGELRAIVERVLGPRRRGGVHPATRSFQALRIAVNHEIESLAALLEHGPRMLAVGGRMVVLAYHSLEDRAVKENFRTRSRDGGFALVTPKALRPSPSEVASNPRARSARLRCIERSAP
jgi:16S rRNA (cytosine1402-N4)-methyltransferase